MHIRRWEGNGALTCSQVNRWHPLLGNERKYGDWLEHGHWGFEALLGAQVVGTASASFFDGYLGPVRLAVDPRHRRQGIGSALLDATLAEAPDAQEVRVVRVGREAATMLTARGFTPSKTDDELYLHDVSHAAPPGPGFLVVQTVPEEHRGRVTVLTEQYNRATDMPGFEPFADEPQGFLVLGLTAGQVWGVATAVDACADGWGVSERLLVDEALRGQGRGLALKLAQRGAARERGWCRMLVMATGGGHPAARANARAGGRLVATPTWIRS